MKYVKIRSWHLVATPTRAFQTFRTRCGRTVKSFDTAPELPLDEKSCETCLRLAARDG